MLAVTVLVCSMMALSEAAARPEAEAGNVIAPVIQEGKSPVVQRLTSCPSGWTGYKGSCFHYIPTAMTWARAEKNCQSMGANLASVHSAEEYHELQRMIVSITHAYRETWIGGSDAQEEGVWLWSDGSSFNYRHCGGFDNWGGKQHCLQMNYGGQKCWDDCQCSYKRPFVCAKKI